MDKRIVKLQVKVFLEGDEENAITMNSDIFKTPGALSPSLAIPDIQSWIRRAAQALYEGRRPVARLSSPDPELLQSINIVETRFDDLDVKIETKDAASDLAEDVKIKNDVQSGDLSFSEEDIKIAIVADLPEADKSLDIAVTPVAVSDEQEKKQLRVIVRKAALEKAKAHAREDTSRETGGVMLGMFFEDEQTVTVLFTAIVQALRAVRETSSVNFTPETWAEIWQSIDNHPDYSDDSRWGIVGWYHTHPGFGIFLSGIDKFIQKEYFTRKGHLALVIDPVRKEDGIFVTNKDTGETPILEKGIVTIVDDKKLIQQINTMQDRIKLKTLPPDEITLGHDENKGEPTPLPKKTNLKDKIVKGVVSFLGPKRQE